MNRDAAAAIERIYRAEGDRIWRAVRSFAGDPAVADDAVAEAFAQALRRGSAIHSPLSWIWRTSFRIAAAELKERSKFGSLEDADSAYELPEAIEPMLVALQKLSPKQRGSVVLYHYAGYSMREVAAILNSTGPAVRVHLSRARKRLRDLLEDDIHA